MAITVAPGTVNRIRRQPESITIQVQQASDGKLAADALGRAGDDISGMGGGTAPGLAPGERIHPKYVSTVMWASSGPFLMIDAVDSPRRLVATIPDVVVARLEEAGVANAVVACPREGGPLVRMFANTGLARAATLMLYPRPLLPGEEFRNHKHEQIRDPWLVEAAEWVGSGLSEDDDLHARVVSVEFEVRVGDALAMLRQSAAGGGSLELVSGILHQRIRHCTGRSTGALSVVAMAAGGPATDDAELVATFNELVDVARRVAPEVAYATVSIDPAFLYRGATDWHLHHGGEDSQLVEHLCDEYVIDAFAYQVLGPPHLALLGGPPPGADILGGGRAGVAIGLPVDWLLAPPENAWRSLDNLCGRRRDPGVVERGRHLLGPCMLRAGEFRAIHDARMTRGPLPR